MPTEPIKLKFISPTLADKSRPLAPCGGLQASVHVFEKTSIHAINAALAARRPLLVRGETGTGKSQLARAAAEELGRVFVSKVVDAQTEARDLLWTLDAVARLGQAQLLGSLPAKEAHERQSELDAERFVTPGPLWWAFSWGKAADQAELVRRQPPPQPETAGLDPSHGAVVLLDEVDKADSSVPNGLLEALGNGCFPGPTGAPVELARDCPPPLILVTTNEERSLPDAFLRRCLVLHLALPSDRPEDEQAFLAWLVRRGETHFSSMNKKVLLRAAQLLLRDRRAVRATGLAVPGQAEYLDLLRALEGLVAGKVIARKGQLAFLEEELAGFALQKHPREELR